jgi:hypothetical protein
MATRKKKFLYVILTAHYFKIGDTFKQRLGYGVTNDPGIRVRKYSNTSGGEQEFIVLYHSPNYDVMEVERILKQRLSDDCHTINGEEVEWISPYSSINTEILTSMIENIIKELNKPIRRIRKEFLPFKDAEWQDVIDTENIELYPDVYTEPVYPI